MKIYVFEYVDKLTEFYHCGGGLVVAAKSKEEVNKLISEYPNIKLSEDDWNSVQIYDLASTVESKVYVFPDAGCC